MGGGSSDGSSFQSSQNIGSAFLANLFGQGAAFNGAGLTFGAGPQANIQPQFAPARGTPLPGGSRATGTGAEIPPGSFFGGAQFGQSALPGGGGLGSNNFNGSGSNIGNVPQGGFAPQVFQPSDFMTLRGLLDSTQRNSLQDSALGIGQQGVDSFNNIFQSVLGPGQQALGESLSTGFRTDIQPIVDVERRRFERETVPGLAEQFAGLTGGFSSDFRNSLLNASTDLGVNLGGQQAALDEAASGRRLAALTAAPAGAAALTQLPFAAANAGLGLGAQIQEDQFLSSPAAQLMRNLTNIFSLSPPTTGGTSENSSKQGGI